MISRALKLQRSVQLYVERWQRPADKDHHNLRADQLDDDGEWEELRHYAELLEPFDRATKRVEGNAFTGSHGALWEVIPLMDYLFRRLQRFSEQVTAEPDLFTNHYWHALNHGFAKLKTYYSKIDDSRKYAASVAYTLANASIILRTTGCS